MNGLFTFFARRFELIAKHLQFCFNMSSKTVVRYVAYITSNFRFNPATLFWREVAVYLG